MNKPSLTFVLPGDGRSGGVRVTVLMANLLLARGYAVRLVCPRRRVSWRTRFDQLISALTHAKKKSAGFLHQFEGDVLWYRYLDELNYTPDEIVIGVGTYSMPDLVALTKPVTKLRFNHGFPAKPDALQEQAWCGPMPTITVSHTLVPKLQELTGGRVLGVVPNGIDLREYFVDHAIARTGIGVLYNRHPNKAPEDLVAVLRLAHKRWPDVSQHVFSTERRPLGLEHVNFTQLPSVAEARAIYNRCKVWLLTSLTEGLPGVVLEAMACGCVVVSSDNDGSLEIIRHENNGLVAPRGDRAAFVEEVGRILADEPLRHRLATAAGNTVRQFSWERAADRMEACLHELRRGPSVAPALR